MNKYKNEILSTIYIKLVNDNVPWHDPWYLNVCLTSLSETRVIRTTYYPFFLLLLLFRCIGKVTSHQSRYHTCLTGLPQIHLLFNSLFTYLSHTLEYVSVTSFFHVDSNFSYFFFQVPVLESLPSTHTGLVLQRTRCHSWNLRYSILTRRVNFFLYIPCV